jgi:hypothetical protein
MVVGETVIRVLVAAAVRLATVAKAALSGTLASIAVAVAAAGAEMFLRAGMVKLRPKAVPGGFRCGGAGRNRGDGQDASCAGGGGGGAGGNRGSEICHWFFACYRDGGQGNFGGGGGGGTGDGGKGGFGGGGGAGYERFFHVSGGDGGFGGGGGGAYPDTFWKSPGKGGKFGGRGDDSGNGGGGGALGGAIFNRNGTVEVRNSTFFNNYVTRGERGGGSAANGADAGGAIFSVSSPVEITNSTFSGNQATGSGAAIVVYQEHVPVSFILNNNIIANNGANECFFTGNVTAGGAGNLIMQNGSGTKPFFSCPGVVTTSDPQLQPLQWNSPGNTPTMAILTTSPAAEERSVANCFEASNKLVISLDCGLNLFVCGFNQTN